MALREIRATLKGVTRVTVHRRQRVGRIHFRYDRSPKQLLALRCVEGVFALLKEFSGVTAGRPGLLRVANAVSDVDLGPGVVLYNILNGIPVTSGVAINCTVGRGHRFTSSELHQILRVVLAETYDLDESEQQGPYYLQVRIEKQRVIIGFRLTKRDPRRSRSMSEPSLPAAYGIGALVRPEQDQVWLDVACGGGAILHAFVEGYGARAAALETRADWAKEARSQLRDLAPDCVGVWNGIQLPVEDDSANGVFVNLRRRHEITFDDALQKECLRVLARHGRVVLLCERDRDLEAAIEEGRTPFRCSDRHPIHLGGDALAIYLLRQIVT